MTLKSIGDLMDTNKQKILEKQGLIIEAFSKHCLLIDRAKEILKKDLSLIESGEIRDSQGLSLEGALARAQAEATRQ